MVPVLQPGQDRQVVGFQHVKAGPEGIGQLAFMDENGGLAFANGQLGAVFDRVADGRIAPDHRVARIVRPFDDLDELAAENVEDRHLFLRRMSCLYAAKRSDGASQMLCATSSVAIWRTMGSASAADIPGRSRGS